MQRGRRQGVPNRISGSGQNCRLTDLNYATCGRVVEETLEMQHEKGWQSLDEDLLARLT